MDFRCKQRLGPVRRLDDPERDPPRRRRDPAGKPSDEVDPAPLFDELQKGVLSDRRDIRISAPPSR